MLQLVAGYYWTLVQMGGRGFSRMLEKRMAHIAVAALATTIPRAAALPHATCSMVPRLDPFCRRAGDAGPLAGRECSLVRQGHRTASPEPGALQLRLRGGWEFYNRCMEEFAHLDPRHKRICLIVSSPERNLRKALLNAHQCLMLTTA